MLKDALLIDRGLGNHLEIAMRLRSVARALALKGEAGIAAQILSTSEALREEIGFKRSWFGEVSEETLAPIRTQLGNAAFAKAWEEGRKITVDKAVDLALGALESDELGLGDAVPD